MENKVQGLLAEKDKKIIELERENKVLKEQIKKLETENKELNEWYKSTELESPELIELNVLKIQNSQRIDRGFKE